MSKVQSVVFHKDKGWDLRKSRIWLRNHGYSHLEPDYKEETIRFRQREPNDSKKYYTNKLNNGISLVNYT